MKVFIDCEYNGSGGELISMAMVPEDDGPVFYEVLDTTGMAIDPWVEEHVIPVLGDRPPVSEDEFKMRLGMYLDSFDELHIVSDWPDDIRLLMQSMIVGPGVRLGGPDVITLEVMRHDCPSRVPHNALHDAMGIREWMARHDR